jgi:aminoglycoside 6'-N-acetyltransferase I
MKIIEITNEAVIYKCAEIFMAANNAPPWNDHWNIEQSIRRLIDIYKSANFIGFACTENAQIIGFILGNYEIYYDGLHYNLKEMAIANAYQRKGIGSELLKQVVPTLRDKGITAIYLFTSKSNRTNVFYLKTDFQESNSMVMMWKEIKNNRTICP